MSKADNTKEIKFNEGYDKRAPEPSKNYGIGGVRIGFYYGNDRDGFVQFTILTDWYPQPLRDEMKNRRRETCDMFPMPADLGYHSPVPHYDDHGRMDCDMMAQGYCYYDGSTMNAEPIYDILTAEGSDAVWKKLEEYWDDLFGRESTAGTGTETPTDGG